MKPIILSLLCACLLPAQNFAVITSEDQVAAIRTELTTQLPADADAVAKEITGISSKITNYMYLTGEFPRATLAAECLYSVRLLRSVLDLSTLPKAYAIDRDYASMDQSLLVAHVQILRNIVGSIAQQIHHAPGQPASSSSGALDPSR